ncbi:DNA-3-methyladenine glycosylase 2 family protein [Nocardia camponoti]|uniref:DNA-3-methyladenine glycosylase II n=1 Tax=Nocardia camponoti TaxID=1616106 RepID=A0A917QGH9_9NOCA|nr:AlkA N-terminal domain-containing protein [Nocardia camponoti]GGK47898.1 hypothetical protein GCM10011591_19060 [Nocardia camponoti]
MTTTALDFERCYRAVSTRDARFDGQFITAVRTTGIYCRPSCPAITPKRANVSFLPTAAAAQQAGYRACRRCLPDAAPGSPLWNVRADLAARAMRLIGDGAIERDGVPGLAAALGYSSRQLTRVLTTELGAGPLALARAHRAHTARLLIQTTSMPMSDIAFAAGFASIRQFNDTVREVFAVTPTVLRTETRTGPRSDIVTPGVLTLRLPYREPLDVAWLTWFLSSHTVAGMETFEDGVYRRALATPHGHAVIALSFAPGHVRAELSLVDMRDLAPVVARVRHLLDLDADPLGVDEVLGMSPGIRVPGSVDGSELLLRTMIGQQISVRAASTHTARLVGALGVPVGRGLQSRVGEGDLAVVATDSGAGGTQALAGRVRERGVRHVDKRALEDERGRSDVGRAALADERGGSGERGGDSAALAHGGGTLSTDQVAANGLRLFPTAAVIAERGREVLVGPARRIDAIVEAARALADGSLVIHAARPAAELRAELLALRGVGPWTADYVTMRAVADPDILLDTDLVVRRGAELAGVDLRDTARFAPWRSYLSMHLWRTALLPREENQ